MRLLFAPLLWPVHLLLALGSQRVRRNVPLPVWVIAALLSIGAAALCYFRGIGVGWPLAAVAAGFLGAEVWIVSDKTQFQPYEARARRPKRRPRGPVH